MLDAVFDTFDVAHSTHGKSKGKEFIAKKHTLLTREGTGELIHSDRTSRGKLGKEKCSGCANSHALAAEGIDQRQTLLTQRRYSSTLHVQQMVGCTAVHAHLRVPFALCLGFLEGRLQTSQLES